MSQYKFDTLAVHAGYTPDSTNSVAVPIYQTSAYNFDSTEHAQRLFELEEVGNIYTRLTNPTVGVLEARVAALEGGVAAVAMASGHAAIFATILNLACAGDEIVSSLFIYGGAINLFAVTLRNLGITVKFVTEDTPEAWEAQITDKTKAIFAEAVGNPNANVTDLDMVSALAKKHGIPFIVDSTFTTPYLLRPIEYGADIVIHSATKFMGGQGSTMAGIVVDSGNFVFAGNPRFPQYNSPDPSYHGKIFATDFGNMGFALRLRGQILRDIGGCLSPFNAFMIIQGLETLALRMARHCENAIKVAEFLAAHPQVKLVNYPTLANNKYKPLADKYLPKGAGSVFTFELVGGKAAGAKFINSLSLLKNVANVGDTRSLVIHPATTTHSQLTEDQLRQSGITGGTVRLSVGIEDAADIIADLNAAIAAATK